MRYSTKIHKIAASQSENGIRGIKKIGFCSKNYFFIGAKAQLIKTELLFFDNLSYIKAMPQIGSKIVTTKKVYFYERDKPFSLN